MAYRVAICDDSKIDAEYVKQILCRWAKDRGADVCPEVFPSAESFLWKYEEDQLWDILLLDIEMGTMDGVTLAKRIRKGNEAAQIVFITGFPDFMAEGYEVSALHYLLKPVKSDKLYAVLDKAVNNLAKKEKRLAISFDRETEYVPLDKITYIEAQKQYVVVRTETQEYCMKTSLASTEKDLDEYFFRCQRSFIVNLRYVLRIGNDHVILKNGAEVPISRGMAQKIGKEIIRLF
ncbi:MAG: LytTR family DNA-binding domain-containing protein [Lachnospiraceae bacterium]|nr:LytTR family DNA-binding domain-containing protein [Lachnospiraceae bacterium]